MILAALAYVSVLLREICWSRVREIHIAGWDYVVPEGMSFLCVLSLLAVLAARGSSYTVWRLLVMPRAFSVPFTVYPRGPAG